MVERTIKYVKLNLHLLRMYWRRDTKFGQAACDATQAAEDHSYSKQDVINAFKQVDLSNKLDVINTFKQVGVI